MIKSTFYNLSLVKQRRIVEAVLNEFAAAVDDKVSINNIIREAKISRGSFYQYFDDKIDLVEVVSNALFRPVLDMFPSIIENSGGDIFAVYEDMFNSFMDIAVEERNARIITNLIRMTRTNGNIMTVYMESRFRGFSELRDLTSKLPRDRYRFNSDEDMLHLQKILNAVTKQALVAYHNEKTDDALVRDDYSRRLEIIRRGALL